MKRIILGAVMLSFAALSGCAMMPMTAGDIAKQDTNELCVAAAETAMTGQPALIDGREAGRDAVIQELKSRQSTCSPWQTYVQTAQMRLQYRLQQQAAQAQQSAAILAESAALQNMAQPKVLGPAIQQPQQSHTVCHVNAFGQTVCDTTTN